MKKPTFSKKNTNKNDGADLMSFYWNSTKGDTTIAFSTFAGHDLLEVHNLLLRERCSNGVKDEGTLVAALERLGSATNLGSTNGATCK